MALAKKQSNSLRIVVIGIVILAVAWIGYVLFQKFFLKNDTNGANANSANSQRVITNFGESILNDPRFTNLKSFNTTTNADANRDGGQANPFQ